MPKLVGYAGVSTQDQDVKLQIDALAAAHKIVKTAQMQQFISVMSSYKMAHFQMKEEAK